MIYRRSPYRGDQDALLALVHSEPSAHLHVTDVPYRLSSWAFDDPDNLCLWLDDEDQLAAWAVLQTPFWAVDYAICPDAPPDLHSQVLAWADRRAQAARGTASARPMWFVNVFPDQQQRIADLEAAGWACQSDVGEYSWSKVFMVRSADDTVADAPLPPGFTIRPLQGASEVAAYVALHRAVFESESMTEEWRQRTLRAPGYLPQLDLVAVAPDGRLAGFCVCWFDPDGPTHRPAGQIEPLGVHSDFRGQGLGRAMVAEGLRRLHQHGAMDVFVETDNYRDAAFALYEAAGFRVMRDVLVYRKDYTQEP